MKVSELIERLNKLDPDSDVRLCTTYDLSTISLKEVNNEGNRIFLEGDIE